MRRGILGGTFDPIHIGHLIIAEAVREQLRLDEIAFLPAGQPWMKKDQPLSAAHHRKTMIGLAIAGNPAFSLLTNELDRPGDTYTVDTLTELTVARPSDELFFIMGADSLLGFPRWKEPGRILEMAYLAVVMRPGYDAPPLDILTPETNGRVTFVEAPLIQVSGTDIRERVAQGKSIRYRVPEAVAAYIAKHKLYRAPARTPS